MRIFFLTTALIAPAIAFAAGGGSTTPPKPTETTTNCSGAKVWDSKTRSCVDSRESSLSDQDRYDAVQELAYAGAYDRAQEVLATFEIPESSGALTYAGFIARKRGDLVSAFVYYARALDVDPDNILARSYMGQGYVAQGDLAAARDQLQEIRARGGRETWAEFALETAIRTGRGYSY
ncbi:MAG: tetratricopeptide repeat protein [Dinoroseobacter sp.]|nr:tetratricopeptide repeat protein [Dinoroseobacter sp.]